MKELDLLWSKHGRPEIRYLGNGSWRLSFPDRHYHYRFGYSGLFIDGKTIEEAVDRMSKLPEEMIFPGATCHKYCPEYYYDGY